MIDEYQIIESKAMGADVILLIAKMLKPQEISNLAKLAKSLGMEVLLETHTRIEIEENFNQNTDMDT